MSETVFSVGRVNAYIKGLFDNDFALRQIAVRGEVSNCKYHTSGHIYFTLKDDTGVLNAVMFRGNAARGLRFRLNDGQQVIVRGHISIYEKDGRYQLYASEIVADGLGDLNRRFEETKKRLSAMGMFDSMYKKPIPAYAFRIGVVTASTGAAVRDIENVISRRNPAARIYLYPALVQGEGAAPSIVRAINALDSMGMDVLIVGRGGGSIEDLWAFNEESVARAIFDCETPVVTGIGHETDFTISDFVADLRAPTPSAAAEQAVFDAEAFKTDLLNYSSRLKKSLRSGLSEQKLRLERSRLRLETKTPTRLVENRRGALLRMEDGMRHFMELSLAAERTRIPEAQSRLQKSIREKLSGCSADFDGAAKRLPELMRALTEAGKNGVDDKNSRLIRRMRDIYSSEENRLKVFSARLEGNSPLKALAGGYGYITGADGKRLGSIVGVEAGDRVDVTLSDGRLETKVENVICMEVGHG